MIPYKSWSYGPKIFLFGFEFYIFTLIYVLGI